jgi:hypothetical protein
MLTVLSQPLRRQRHAVQGVTPTSESQRFNAMTAAGPTELCRIFLVVGCQSADSVDGSQWVTGGQSEGGVVSYLLIFLAGRPRLPGVNFMRWQYF